MSFQRVWKHTFPEDKEECDSWIRALPNSNLTYEEVQHKSKNGCPSKCVCAPHWPPGVPTKLRNNHQVAQYFLLICPVSVLFSTSNPSPLMQIYKWNPDVEKLGDHNHFPPLWLNTFSYKLQKQLVDRKKQTLKFPITIVYKFMYACMILCDCLHVTYVFFFHFIFYANVYIMFFSLNP